MPEEFGCAHAVTRMHSGAPELTRRRGAMRRPMQGQRPHGRRTGQGSGSEQPRPRGGSPWPARVVARDGPGPALILGRCGALNGTLGRGAWTPAAGRYIMTRTTRLGHIKRIIHNSDTRGGRRLRCLDTRGRVSLSPNP